MSEILDENIVNNTKSFYYNIYVSFIYLAIFFTSWLIETMHWPGSTILLITGASGLISYNAICLIRMKGESTSNNIFSGISGLWIFIVFFGLFFNNGHPLNFNGIILHLGLILVFSVFYLLRKPARRKAPFI